MNNSEKQKKTEITVFESFLKLHDNLSDVEPEYGESSDVICRIDDKVIGVDLCLIPNSEALEALESIKRKIVDETKKICIKKEVDNLHAVISFSSLVGPPNPHYRVSSLKREDRRRISENLADEIVKHSSNLKDSERCDFRPYDIPEIFKVYIQRNSVRSTKDYIWNIPNAGFVQRSAVKNIQSALDKKNGLYKKYMECCDECWLLLWADRSKKSQRFEFDEETRINMYKAKFDKVYYFELFACEIIELCVSDDK